METENWVMKIDHPNSLLVNEKQLGNTMILKEKKKKIWGNYFGTKSPASYSKPKGWNCKMDKKTKKNWKVKTQSIME